MRANVQLFQRDFVHSHCHCQCLNKELGIDSCVILISMFCSSSSVVLLLYLYTHIGGIVLFYRRFLFPAPGLCSLFACTKMLYKRLIDDVLEILGLFRTS